MSMLDRGSSWSHQNSAKEFKSQFDLEPDKTREHHDLGSSAVKKEYDVVDKGSHTET